MIHSLYLVIHQRIKRLKDNQGYIWRKEILNHLKYPVKLDKHVREIIIREMIELGLLKRINSQRYVFIENKRSEKILNPIEAQHEAKLHKKYWFRKV